MADTTKNDPSKLIDLEFVNQLRFCHSIEKHRETEDYEDDLMMKTTQLGKKTQDKLLIFDMDETLVAAKYADEIPTGFE